MTQNVYGQAGFFWGFACLKVKYKKMVVVGFALLGFTTTIFLYFTLCTFLPNQDYFFQKHLKFINKGKYTKFYFPLRCTSCSSNIEFWHVVMNEK